MRRYFPVVVITGCGLLGLLSLTAINGLMNVSSMSAAEMNYLMQGEVERWFLSSGMWGRYPALVPFSEGSVLFEIRAVGLTIPFILGVYYFRARRSECSYTMVGLMCLLVGVIPYAVGRWMLYGNTMPEKSGPWVATMLLGVWYATLACLLFTMIGLLRREEPREKKEPVECRIIEEHLAPGHLLDWA